jgi:hypothetical protein
VPKKLGARKLKPGHVVVGASGDPIYTVVSASYVPELGKVLVLRRGHSPASGYTPALVGAFDKFTVQA